MAAEVAASARATGGWQIVGGDDHPVLELNRHAMHQMRAPVKLHIVPGATHLFEEPGALQEVGRVAAEWLTKNLK